MFLNLVKPRFSYQIRKIRNKEYVTFRMPKENILYRFPQLTQLYSQRFQKQNFYKFRVTKI